MADGGHNRREMQCDVRGMSEGTEAARTPAETMPRPGRVTEVCREWLVHEDGALAYRLQNEEIEHHYTGNKFRNALVRQDIPCAKDEQRREEQEAATVQALYDQMIREQEEIDARVAQQLAERIEREEQEKRIANEHKDKELARQMQEREKQRLDKLREEREQRVGAAMYVESSPDIAVRRREDRDRFSLKTPTDTFGEGSHSTYYEEALVHDMRRSSLAEGANGISQHKTPPSADPLSDLSDFCLQPDPNMTEEEARIFQEEQDAELARLLQEQESKRRGDPMVDRDRVMAVEAQDHELARMLQDKEKAKAKRARERARQRSLLKKQQREAEGRELEEQTEGGDEEGEERICSSPSTQQGASDWPEQIRPTDLDMRLPAKGTGKPRCPDPPGTLPNIAMVIDPTYGQRAHSSGQQQSAASESVLPPTPSCSTTPALTLPTPDFDEEDLTSSIPPYMPIQGQRRSASLEKKGKKPKVKKEQKDGCKQQ